MAIVESITLTLTLEEAQAIKDVCGSIYGPDNQSRRKHTSAVYKALSTCFPGITSLPNDLNGHLTFKKEGE